MSYKIALQRINEWKDDTCLDLSGLSLTEIPKEILALTNLKFLYLDDNNITDVTPLASLTNLTELFLNHNKIKDVTSLASLIKCQIYY
jgi:Leucine-rich repeat (LRR) protein